MASQHEHDACCADHDHDADLEMMSDPTMASCCERDQRDYDKAMELKRVLTLHDPTSGGVRLRQQLFEPTAHDFAIAYKQQQAYTPSQPTFAALQSEKEKRREEDDDDDSDLDDSDFELDDTDPIFEARRRELEAQIQVAMQNATEGYGIVTETDFTRLLQELRATPEVPCVVLVTNSQVDALRAREVVREMGYVAKKYLGTKFYLVTVRGNGNDEGLDAVSARDLRLKSVPCIVAFRNGEQVDAAALDDKSSVDAATLWEARLVPWLSMCNVLATARQEQNAGATGGARVSRKQIKEQVDEPPAYDCGVKNCRIRFGFEHEHVGPSKEAKSEVSAWRS